MSRFRVGVLMIFLCAGPAFAQGDTTKKPLTDKQIAELITQLGDSLFRTREDAAKKLIEIGKPALPQLKKAAQGENPKIHKRARKIILEIEVAELIVKLGDVRFKVRQGAHQKLVEIGKPALPQLKKAVASEEVEIRMRAAKIIKEIEAPPPPKGAWQAVPKRARELTLMETGIRFVPRDSVHYNTLVLEFSTRQGSRHADHSRSQIALL